MSSATLLKSCLKRSAVEDEAQSTPSKRRSVSINDAANVMRFVAYYGRPDHSPDLAKACFYTEDDFQYFEADASRKPRKRAVGTKRRQQRAAGTPLAQEPLGDDGSRGRHASVFEYDFYSDEEDAADVENQPQQQQHAPCQSPSKATQCESHLPAVAHPPANATTAPSKAGGLAIRAIQTAATLPTAAPMPAPLPVRGLTAASAPPPKALPPPLAPLSHPLEPPRPQPQPELGAGRVDERVDEKVDGRLDEERGGGLEQARPSTRRDVRLMSEIKSSVCHRRVPPPDRLPRSHPCLGAANPLPRATPLIKTGRPSPSAPLSSSSGSRAPLTRVLLRPRRSEHRSAQGEDSSGGADTPRAAARRRRVTVTSPHLTSPHLTSPRLASPRLASPHNVLGGVALMGCRRVTAPQLTPSLTTDH